MIAGLPELWADLFTPDPRIGMFPKRILFNTSIDAQMAIECVNILTYIYPRSSH
jgi:hypothetical protein